MTLKQRPFAEATAAAQVAEQRARRAGDTHLASAHDVETRSRFSLAQNGLAFLEAALVEVIDHAEQLPHRHRLEHRFQTQKVHEGALLDQLFQRFGQCWLLPQ